MRKGPVFVGSGPIHFSGGFPAAGLADRASLVVAAPAKSKGFRGPAPILSRRGLFFRGLEEELWSRVLPSF